MIGWVDPTPHSLQSCTSQLQFGNYAQRAFFHSLPFSPHQLLRVSIDFPASRLLAFQLITAAAAYLKSDRNLFTLSALARQRNEGKKSKKKKSLPTPLPHFISKETRPSNFLYVTPDQV